MKIAVIGAGAIGSAIASDLSTRDDVAQIKICDSHARLLQELHARIDSPKLRSYQSDARDPRILSSVLMGCDVAIGCVPARLNPQISRLCLDLGVHFCDLGGDDDTLRAALALNAEAQSKSVWVVPNCGLSPGLVNILSRTGIAYFDTVKAVHIRVGDVPLHPEPPFNFRLSWSAEKILDDYTIPVQIIENGEVKTIAPLSNDEEIHFPEPFQTMEAFSTTGGYASLVDDFSGQIQTLDHKTIRWPGHANQMRFIIGLGFAQRQKIDARTHLTFRDVLVRRLRSRLGGDYQDAVLMRVMICGHKDGRDQTLVYEMVDFYDEETGLSAIQRCTSIPTATIACLLASRQMAGGGAAPAELAVPAHAFLKALADRGLKITTRWLEGHVNVATLA
ncbi:MAG: saccharopine dehydrogenase C-terminal domain-containing protein [Rhodothermales bacterium]